MAREYRYKDGNQVTKEKAELLTSEEPLNFFAALTSKNSQSYEFLYLTPFDSG